MKSIPLLSFIYSPRNLHDFSKSQDEMVAVTINAITGVLIVLAAATLSQMFTVTMALLLGILFGPLVGFALSSIYSRIEWFVGTKMGGKASRSDLYRIFAWSFLPLGCASLVL